MRSPSTRTEPSGKSFRLDLLAASIALGRRTVHPRRARSSSTHRSIAASRSGVGSSRSVSRALTLASIVSSRRRCVRLGKGSVGRSSPLSLSSVWSKKARNW